MRFDASLEVLAERLSEPARPSSPQDDPEAADDHRVLLEDQDRSL